ncbi:MAG: efflux RND transporter periplasmic adaptor subunit [Clostridia bacterium]|nr:efflux RND transporter periplasmic adaptor subunit [Clostridia bacterium]
MLKKQHLLLFSSIISISLLFSGCGSKATEESTEADATITQELSEETYYVKSEVVSLQPFNNEFIFPGKAEPVQTVVITAKTSGDVKSAPFDIGDAVKAGDILMTLDDENHRLAASTAKLSLEQASIQLNTAKDDAERSRVLYENGALSKTTMDNIDNAYKQANIGYKTAKNAYDTATINLNNTTVESPIDGIVSEKNFDIGENISPGTEVYTVVNTQQINVIVGVPEQSIQGITTGQEAVLTSQYSDKRWSGTIINISPVMDPQSYTYTAKILVDNTDGSLKSGMSLDVIITTGVSLEKLAFNKLGLILESEDTYVYLNDNGKAKMVPVTVGRANDDYYEIIDGLAPGDEVITEGSAMLETGDSIQVNN